MINLPCEQWLRRCNAGNTMTMIMVNVLSQYCHDDFTLKTSQHFHGIYSNCCYPSSHHHTHTYHTPTHTLTQAPIPITQTMAIQLYVVHKVIFCHNEGVSINRCMPFKRNTTISIAATIIVSNIRCLLYYCVQHVCCRQSITYLPLNNSK